MVIHFKSNLWTIEKIKFFLRAYIIIVIKEMIKGKYNETKLCTRIEFNDQEEYVLDIGSLLKINIQNHA